MDTTRSTHTTDISEPITDPFERAMHTLRAGGIDFTVVDDVVCDAIAA